MAWSPVSGLPPQNSTSGNQAADYWIKFYASGTSTPTSMATDSTGGTTLAKAQTDGQGYFQNGSSDPFIPHINKKYRAVLYANDADADANAFASAVYDIDALFPVATTSSETTITKATIAAAKADDDLVVGSYVRIAEYTSGNPIDALYIVGAGWGTDNGGSVINSDTATLFNLQLVNSDNLINPLVFGINLDGSDETSKWQSLIDYCVANKLGIGGAAGSTLITSQLVFPAGFGGIYGNNQLYMEFVKGFNGNMFSLNAQGMVLENFWIKGDGANFTGAGVYVVSDNINIKHMRITDTADSGVLCQGVNSAYLDVETCFIQPTLTTTSSIRSDAIDPTPGPTVRRFSNISGATSIDVSGMNQVVVEDSLFSEIKTSANTGKLVLTKNRISAAANNITILGTDHIINNNNITHGIGFATTISGSNINWGAGNNYVVDTNTKASPVVSDAFGGAMTNQVHSNLKDFTANVAWEGATINGTFGNSTYGSRYKLSGRECWCNFTMVRGSTATLPTGAWSITLPYKALVNSNCSVLIKSSSGIFYSALGQVQGGSDNLFFYLEQGTAAIDQTTLAFSTNSQLEFSINYLMAAS